MHGIMGTRLFFVAVFVAWVNVAFAAPVITPTTSLQHTAVALGASATFSVTASGSGTLAYQWKKDGVGIAGQTTASLFFASVQAADEADYTVTVSDAFGATTSEPARLWVVPTTSQYISGSYTDASGFRVPYFYILPMNYSIEKRYPLWVMFHGASDDETSFVTGTGAQGFSRVCVSYGRQVSDPAIAVYVTRRAGAKGSGDWTGYPLQKSWIVDRAAQGWLILDVAAHDVPGDMPQAFYDALPAMIKQYHVIYNDDRDRCYFLRMFLGDYRALEYLASRPDWDGKILVVTGGSMGGQQSFAMAGLNPKVTHMIVDVPAGADTNAVLHGRHEAYPFWDSTDPKVMQTALYFDPVNFAPRIRAVSLVSMGFIDNVSTPTGIWTAFNQMPGPKEVVPLVYAAHTHQSTPEQMKPYTERSEAWFASLARGEEPQLIPVSTH